MGRKKRKSVNKQNSSERETARANPHMPRCRELPAPSTARLSRRSLQLRGCGGRPQPGPTRTTPRGPGHRPAGPPRSPSARRGHRAAPLRGEPPPRHRRRGSPRCLAHRSRPGITRSETSGPRRASPAEGAGAAPPPATVPRLRPPPPADGPGPAAVPPRGQRRMSALPR